VIELPKFLRHYKRDRGSLASGPGPVSPDAAALYSEYWAHDGDSAYAASPRGKWVLFQLRWLEARREWGNW
jgi:hypothetical protein